jgi:hypothetical protein
MLYATLLKRRWENMKILALGNSAETALVDEEDFPILSRYSWRIDPKGYVVTGMCGTTVRLHRFILNPNKNVQLDHKNHNKLDNRKDNLREATNSQNQHNVPKTKRVTSSRYKGVHLRKDLKEKQWSARGSLGNKRVTLGYYLTEEEAAEAYNTFARENYGEFACLNEIEKEW